MERKDLNTIQTERLFLREVNQQVLDELYPAHTDEEARVILGYGTMEELLAEKYKWEKGYTTYRTTFKFFLMEEHASGMVVGSVSLHNMYPEHRRSELGYAMREESAKRKGYTSEAVAAVIKHGFEDLDLNRIEAFASPANTGSVKVLLGAGFTEEGLLRQHYCKNNVIEDSACFGLLRHEYEARKK